MFGKAPITGPLSEGLKVTSWLSWLPAGWGPPCIPGGTSPLGSRHTSSTDSKFTGSEARFWHWQHLPFTSGPFLAGHFSHPIPSSKPCWALTLKGCALDSAESSAPACLAGRFPQEIPDINTFKSLGGWPGFPERGPPNSHPVGRQSLGSCCREGWALILCMENLTYLPFFFTVSSWSSDLWTLCSCFSKTTMDLPVGAEEKNPPASAGDVGLIAGLGRCHVLRST